MGKFFPTVFEHVKNFPPKGGIFFGVGKNFSAWGNFFWTGEIFWNGKIFSKWGNFFGVGNFFEREKFLGV